MARYEITLDHDILYIHVDLVEASASICYEDPCGDVVPTAYQTADAGHDLRKAVCIVIADFGYDYWLLDPSHLANLTDDAGRQIEEKVFAYISKQIVSIAAADEDEVPKKRKAKVTKEIHFMHPKSYKTNEYSACRANEFNPIDCTLSLTSNKGHVTCKRCLRYIAENYSRM